MQGIYTYIPKINYIPREYSVAAILLLLLVVFILLDSVLNLLLLLLYNMCVSCQRPFLPGTSLEPAVIPTAHASSFTLQYFPYYV